MSIPSAVILYHFFYPDDVVSARHFAQFSQELVMRGWDLTALTSNRYCRYPKKKIIALREKWCGIQIVRVGRPPWNQAKNFPRLANTGWMLVKWAWKLFRHPSVDVIIIGTDPPFSALLFPILKKLKPKALLIHWCYDLYPEAIISDGAKGLSLRFAKALKFLMRWAYRALDGMVDIGPCMRKRLEAYDHCARSETLVPWALVEPQGLHDPDLEIRRALFGEAELTLLYSGNMGKAHEFILFIELARILYKHNPKIIFCFACRGNRYQELKEAVTVSDLNIKFAPFAEEVDLEKRLLCADIHLVSLREEWAGVVVPSKFFGSLAAGKPVIYSGTQDASLPCWIGKFDVGFVLTKDTLIEVAQQLLKIADNPQLLRKMREKAYQVYHDHFSKTVVMNRWDDLMREMLSEKSAQ